MTTAPGDDARITPADRAAWLEQRRTGIGASEAAAALGVCPYRTPLALYLLKSGLAPEPEETEAMRWGTRLEPLLREAYVAATGNRVVAEQVYRKSAADPHLFATLDGVTESGWPVEFKAIGLRGAGDLGPAGSDDLPERWLLQAHQQMHCAAADRVDFAVLVGGQEFRIYTVRRDDDLLAAMLPRLAEFWARVERREPPPATRAADAALYAALHPTAAGSIRLGEAAALDADRYADLGAEIRRLEESRGRHKAKLLAALGGAALGTLPDGRTLTRKVVRVAARTVEHKAYEFVDLRIKRGRCNYDREE